MKKEYTTPIIEIEEIIVEDIITESGLRAKNFGDDTFDDSDDWGNLFN